MKKLIFFPAYFIIYIAVAQLPETDIFLCHIRKDSSNYTFSRPENITNRKGYDNQPFFIPNENKILYVSVVDSTQSDIYVYDINEKISRQYTYTKESEYSPSFTPDKKYVSVVRVDADSGQRYYRLPLDDLKNPALVKNTDSIGYACWLNDMSLAMFILGPANTLQVLNLKNSERKLIASDIGRCMKLSPDNTSMYFVLKSNPDEWYIYSMNCKDYSLKRIVATLPHCEDFAVLSDGSLIMGKDGKLYLNYNNSDWKMIGDFSNELTDFYRISVNKEGTFLALVAFTGKKP